MCSWYPNRLEPLNGDFVQRHARAAALYNDIYLIHIAGDYNATDDEHLIQNYKGLTEHIVYYKKAAGLAGKLFSFRRWRVINKKLISKYIAENGKPDLVHVHVALKSGLMALWAKKKYGIDYVLSEHWSGYLPEAEDNIYKRHSLYKKILSSIIGKATAVVAVSEYLLNAIRNFSEGKRFSVIPNVVDTAVFHLRPQDEKKSFIQFIHISTLNHPKNPEAIFEAFGIAKIRGLSFRLVVVSSDINNVNRLAAQFGIEKETTFFSEMPQGQLQKLVHQSDALVLFSRYETFGCVVTEANACGKPVIVSDIPAMRENVVSEENGVFAVNGNANDLADKILWFAENKNRFNAKAISTKAVEKFSFETVGKMFDELYR